jgi:hypothetical protein
MERRSNTLPLRSTLLFLGLGISLIVTQSGCPAGAELEHPEAWAGRVGSGGTPGTGGSTGATGGTAAAGGAKNWVFDINSVACANGLNAATIIGADCAKGGCHKGTLAAAGLDLSNPAQVANKTKDKPATHLGIQCSAPTEPYMECVPTTCPPAGSALLVNSANVEQSWVLQKLDGSAAALPCGTTMPDETYATASPDKLACVEAAFRAIAALQ